MNLLGGNLLNTKKVLIFLTLLVLNLLFIAGCSKYQKDFMFTGTVEDILIEDEMLVMKEYNASDGRKEGNVYEIPVDNVKEYTIGQKLEVTVFSNTDADIWDLDRMKFEIKTID